MKKCVIMFCLAAFVASSGQAQELEGEVTTASTENAPVQTTPISASCKVATPIAYRLEFPSAEGQVLPDPDTNLLATVAFRDCQFKESLTGALNISVEIALDFNETVDVQRCQSVSVHLLLESSSVTPEFSWQANRRLVDDGSITNPYGLVRNIAYFPFHSRPSGEAISLRSLISVGETEPSYSDLFWGRINVVEEPSGAGLSGQLIRWNSIPENSGKTVEFQVRPYEPRGLCIYAKSVGTGDDATIEIDSILLVSKEIK